mmetsp:Transcript_54840/g.138563  ORF Transcript_54840/g.138563 Transcript_54840/m.138563 type:complete len:362 (-) Transcript_54840:1358-2443(-)
MCEPARKVEHQRSQHHVQHHVRVPREVHREGGHELFCVVGLDVPVGADDVRHELEGQEDRHEGLDYERDQEGRGEGVRHQVLPQRALHRVGLEALCERVDLGKRRAMVSPHVDADHHPVRHVVRHDHVQQNVGHASEAVQQHVANLAIIHDLESDAVRNLAAHVVHEAVAHDHYDCEGEVRDHARLLAVAVIEGHDEVGVWRIEAEDPNSHRGHQGTYPAGYELHFPPEGHRDTVCPIDGGGLEHGLLHLNLRVPERQPDLGNLLQGCVARTLRLEHYEGLPRSLQIMADLGVVLRLHGVLGLINDGVVKRLLCIRAKDEALQLFKYPPIRSSLLDRHLQRFRALSWQRNVPRSDLFRFHF